MEKDTLIILAVVAGAWLLLRPRAVMPVQQSPYPYDQTTYPNWAPQQQQPSETAQIIGAVGSGLGSILGGVGSVMGAYNGG